MLRVDEKVIISPCEMIKYINAIFPIFRSGYRMT